MVDSMIYSVGNNIGVGTSAPRAQLQVGIGAPSMTLTTALSANDALIKGRLEVDGAVYINSNVGIGTTAPAANLHVGIGAPSMGLGTPLGTNDALIKGELEVDSALYVNGNVGIGTTVPAARFHVGLGAPSMALTIPLGTNDGLIKGRLEVDSTLYINASVGIGTTAPQQKLEVRGGAILGSEFAVTTAASMTVDWSNGNQQYVALNQAGHTINLSNYKVGQILRLVVCQDGTGGRTVTSWDATIVWAAGTAPTLTSGASKCDVVSFVCTNAKGSVKNFGAVTANF
jgi:hypothetical protein